MNDRCGAGGGRRTLTSGAAEIQLYEEMKTMEHEGEKSPLFEMQRKRKELHISELVRL